MFLAREVPYWVQSLESQVSAEESNVNLSKRDLQELNQSIDDIAVKLSTMLSSIKCYNPLHEISTLYLSALKSQNQDVDAAERVFEARIATLLSENFNHRFLSFRELQECIQDTEMLIISKDICKIAQTSVPTPVSLSGLSIDSVLRRLLSILDRPQPPRKKMVDRNTQISISPIKWEMQFTPDSKNMSISLKRTNVTYQLSNKRTKTVDCEELEPVCPASKNYHTVIVTPIKRVN
ncbi:hypothetical protein Ciccas_000697 [Cichlidogyrus casuarinus]|uniref:Uncharacterized protein n=1 Tax=Cichlidogyrus casuarinus TaxID=1844966 RepID=A0ABD2QML0_9PLAT